MASGARAPILARMPRGPHPQDAKLFGEPQHAKLRRACEELAWLLTRGYVLKSSLKLVGDRYALVGRQRDALSRAVCTDGEREERASKRRRLADIDADALATAVRNANELGLINSSQGKQTSTNSPQAVDSEDEEGKRAALVSLLID